MEIPELIQLYMKERQYEKNAFGDYKDIKSLNVASFLVLLRNYIERAEKSYVSNWDSNLPSWLISCSEHEQGNTAPVKVYEDLIKILALAGAALESYATINPNKWRENQEEECKKWK